MNNVLEFKPIEMDDDFFDEEVDEEPLEVKEARARFKMKQEFAAEQRKQENDKVKKSYSIKTKAVP